MAGFPTSTIPKLLEASQHTSMPSTFRRMGLTSEHSRNQKRGQPIDSFIEGPIIIPIKNKATLVIVDIPYGRIFAIDLETLSWSLIVEYDGEPNGLAWHPLRKQIIIADFKQGILTLDPVTKEITPMLTRLNGQRFLGPNDLIVAGDGSIFFTDQGLTGLQDPSGKVYRHWPDATPPRTDVVLRNCPSPNGLVLDKLETTLFVNMTRDNAVWQAPLYPDGTTQRTGRFSSYYGIGGPDGMTLDVEGNVFVAHVSLGCIFVHRPNGEPLAKITVPKGTHVTNMTWGGENGDELFITESEFGEIWIVKWHCRGWLGKMYHGEEGV